MGKLFSINFWLSALASTFVTLACIYVIKQVAGKTNLPVVSDIAETI